LVIEEAFEELREPMLYTMISFCRDPEAAEDAVSHAFTKALLNRQMLELMPEEAMKAWLYASARNAIIDGKRREKRLRELLFLNNTFPLESDDSSERWANNYADKTLVEQLLEKLPDSLRKPVMLKYYEEMNASEIGEEMNLPSATVRTRLRTAMQRLRENYLEEENE